MTDYRPISSAPLNPPTGEVIPEDRAKQGRRGLHMLWVLIASVALIALIYVGLFAFHARPTADTGQAAASQRTSEIAKTKPAI